MDVITGGSGVLGRALARELVEAGRKVCIFDLKSPVDGFRPGMQFVRGSVLDREAVAKALTGAEVVFQLAASMPQAPLTPRGFWEINVGGTLNVAEAAVKAGVRRLVFASTIELYGLYYPHEFPVREESEKRFTGIYSRNKWECEERLLELRACSGLEVVFGRMPMIFGPGFYHEPSIITLFRLIHAGWPVPVVAAPDARWASVSSVDAAWGLRLCAETPAADGEAFNLAAADAPACVEALRELIRRVGSRSRLVLIPMRWTERMLSLIERYEKYSPTPAELVRFALVGGVYSIDKARQVLGFEPRLTAVEGMESAYRYLYPFR